VERGEVPLLDVMPNFGGIDLAIVVEWSGDWWENTL
jgi:hypothetical protein